MNRDDLFELLRAALPAAVEARDTAIDAAVARLVRGSALEAYSDGNRGFEARGWDELLKAWNCAIGVDPVCANRGEPAAIDALRAAIEDVADAPAGSFIGANCVLAPMLHRYWIEAIDSDLDPHGCADALLEAAFPYPLTPAAAELDAERISWAIHEITDVITGVVRGRHARMPS